MRHTILANERTEGGESEEGTDEHNQDYPDEDAAVRYGLLAARDLPPELLGNVVFVCAALVEVQVIVEKTKVLENVQGRLAEHPVEEATQLRQERDVYGYISEDDGKVVLILEQ